MKTSKYKALSRVAISLMIITIMIAGAAMITPAEEEKYFLLHDDTYTYSYDENGYCISAEAEDGRLITFKYVIDINDLPIKRYKIEGDNTELFEEYSYDANDRLQVLTVYANGEDQPPQVWTYDETGRAVSVKNYPPVPVTLLCNAFSDVEFEWSEDGKLVKLVSTYSGTIDDVYELFIRTLGSPTADQADAMVEKANEYLSTHDNEMIDEDLFLFEMETIEFEYDDSGRVVKYTEMMYDSPLYDYTRTGREDYYHVRIQTINFDYSKENAISMTSTLQDIANGEESGITEIGPLEQEIILNEEGQPVQFGEISTDIYDDLNCRVAGAEIGFYGYFWNDTMMPLYGEVHGGIAGLKFNLEYLSAGAFFNLKVEGINENDESVVYIIEPDNMGRQMCEKFTDGKLTMPWSTKIDFEKLNILFIEEDSDILEYQVIQ